MIANLGGVGSVVASWQVSGAVAERQLSVDVQRVFSQSQSDLLLLAADQQTRADRLHLSQPHEHAQRAT